ncbi:hypothetical protein AGABI1DRAFT_109786 [Agaricus bisporus var. burnettii JB137-S8]|uniref:Fungal-type protein kinase domain-containing protein n=1 Tax=Agaricus bisporus var. burnettii (strain JB137-S8 / ATCC MYA-4627 / FGSC 10392) TaxID=597362 RepID=K5WWC5_AGABU|nr:uncharacterized protein AGABI1DRAFT_109786 [Agaricus bisporus var. burnettii JB137-S8]EKM74887.1 hypothetical protein AGABI1DRAFT_109786 [Agaricus bisporus var. burnettii JB137-S8]
MSAGPPFDCSPDPELEVLEKLANGLADELDEAEKYDDVDPLKAAQIRLLQENLGRLMCMLGWAVTSDHLGNKFQITCAGTLELKSESQLSTVTQDWSIGEGLWTEEETFQSLRRISQRYKFSTRKAVLHWIDPVFTRVFAMTSRPGAMSQENCTITQTENARVSGARDGQFYRVAGFIDCSAVPTGMSEVDFLTSDGCDLSRLRGYKYPTRFLFVQAFDRQKKLELKIPQTILEMYACAMCLEKKVIRGVITNSHEWMFLILQLNDDGDGGMYFQSKIFNLVDPFTLKYEMVLERKVFALLTKIISHWVIPA